MEFYVAQPCSSLCPVLNIENEISNDTNAIKLRGEGVKSGGKETEDINFTESNNNNAARKYCIFAERQVTWTQWYYDSIMNYTRKAIKHGWNKIPCVVKQEIEYSIWHSVALRIIYVS